MSGIGLSDAQLARMRTTVLNLLPDTCMVLEPTRVIDEAGGWSEGEGVPVEYNGGFDIPCRIDPTRQYRQGDIFEQEIVISDFIISVPYDAPLLPDRIILCNGINYEVKKLMDSHSWKVVNRAFIVRLN